MTHDGQDHAEHPRTPMIDHGAERIPGGRSSLAWRRRAFLAERQRAEVSFTVGKSTGFHASAEITNGGLLSVAALVSSILLSTAVVVHVSVHGAKRRRRLTDS